MSNAIIWFRDDLRLADNPALKAALDSGYLPIMVHIHDPDGEGDWAPGAASNAWRYKSLKALDDALRKRGSRLRCFHGPSLPILEMLADTSRADAVFWNRRYEPAVEQRDAAIKRALRRRGLRADSYNGALLFEPWEIETRAGDPYKVFTPFWKTALSQWRDLKLWDPPASLKDVKDSDIPTGIALDTLRLAPDRDWDAGFWERWSPGERGASQALRQFSSEALSRYKAHRDLPYEQGTSRLSPYLHFGEVSVHRVVDRLQHADAPQEQIDAAIRQLGWREFSYHLMHHFPQTVDQNLNPKFEDFDWARVDPRRLARWQQGRTGLPIVDAGMRELWHTGWMHNRVRMIVASYLTKHMRTHWLRGARWFWDTLVDADLANNTQGWQWTAGTGADAAPYFRVFNPLLQARKFDPDGVYIARWVPELSQVPVPARFEPWLHQDAMQGEARRYPKTPVVDLKQGRDAALAAYKRLSGKG